MGNIRLKASRNYPSIPAVTGDVDNHTLVLQAMREALEVGQRRTNDLLNSYVRVQELIDLGLITLEGNTTSIIGADLSEIANLGDLSDAAEGQFLRYRSGNWENDGLAASDIAQSFVTQHQAALAIAWSQLTGVPATFPPSSHTHGASDIVSGILATARLGSGTADATKVLGGDQTWRDNSYLRGACWSSSSGAIAPPVVRVPVMIQRAGTLREVVIYTQGGTGSCVVNIWKDTYANFPPTAADDITGGTSPSISSDNKYQNTTLTGWNTTLNVGDVLLFELASSSTFTLVAIQLRIN